MKGLYAVLLSLSVLNTTAQSLSPERIYKLKRAVVKISMNGKPLGSGFFVSKTGDVATCQHLLDNDFYMNPKEIEVRINDSINVKYELYPGFFREDYRFWSAASDLIIITPKVKIPIDIQLLEIGSWSDVKEGDQIYTCGYPLGLDNRFISMGIISTKYVFKDTIFSDAERKMPIKIYSRNQGWMDLTTYKGNSGGPVIKISEDGDKVIGMVSYILAPKELHPFNSVGISGVISIDSLHVFDSVLER